MTDRPATRLSRLLRITVLATVVLVLPACAATDEAVRTNPSRAPGPSPATAATVGQALTDAVKAGDWRTLTALRSPACAATMSETDMQKWVAGLRRASDAFVQGAWTVRVAEAGDAAEVFADVDRLSSGTTIPGNDPKQQIHFEV